MIAHWGQIWQRNAEKYRKEAFRVRNPVENWNYLHILYLDLEVQFPLKPKQSSKFPFIDFWQL